MNELAEMKREFRSVLELRVARQDGSTPKILGHAAVFNSPTMIFDFVEIIEPGAFAETVQQDDIRCLRNHNSDWVLGRNKAGTLTLREDDTGLYFECDPPDTAYANDLLVSIERGDVSGNSFGFFVPPGGDTWRYNEAGVLERRIKKAQVFEVSAGVTFPAYEDTDIAVKRSIEEVRSVGLTKARKEGENGAALRAMADPESEPKFPVGTKVKIVVDPHMEGQTTGEVAEAHLTWVYGIVFDGMEDMGTHKWYIESELDKNDDKDEDGKDDGKGMKHGRAQARTNVGGNGDAAQVRERLEVLKRKTQLAGLD